ncbi:hypothetical protein HT031_000325 [Scenedesmus sp. PABB004]|nr:hypothetical protein HT031_000325 [Scenedesmus sp. PABB004]
MQQARPPHPGAFGALPPAVVEAVLERLARHELAALSTVCRAWAALPYAFVRALDVDCSTAGPAPPPAALPLCVALRELDASLPGVRSAWQPLAAQLLAARLPALRVLRVRHSSGLGGDDVRQLKAILAAQGPACKLHLAVTDRASLLALLGELPVPGLEALDLNVPTLPEGAAELLERAAAAQAAGGGAALRVGVWVCDWGGCSGLSVAEALHLHRRLGAAGCCTLGGLEAVGCAGAADIERLSELTGLRQLGVSIKRATAASGAAAAAGAASPAPSSSGGDGGPLAALMPLRGTLERLTIQGSLPPAPAPAALGAPAPPLAALTGLTKLVLAKQWGAALPVAPIAALTRLRELVVERMRLAHAAELACLGALAELRVLSLTLTVGAAELVDQARRGAWQLAAPPRSVQRGLEDCVRGLAVSTDRGGSAGAACSCCCGGGADGGGGDRGGEQLVAGAPGQGAAHATELLREVAGCPASADADSPALLDWRWLVQLSRLEVAWLHVPHVELAALPPSLTELDAQQPHELMPACVTCTPPGAAWLPRLRRAVLPRVLPPGAAAGGDDNESAGDGDAPAVLHGNAALLLRLALGAPALRELELVQWAVPPRAVCAAAAVLPRLRSLSLMEPERQPAAAAAAELRAALPASPSDVLPRGSRLVLTLSGEVHQPVVAGAASVEVFYWGVPVLTASDTLCAGGGTGGRALQAAAQQPLALDAHGRGASGPGGWRPGRRGGAAGDGATCALAPGPLVLTHEAALPAIAPSGRYSMRLSAADAVTGAPLMCVDVWFRISG